MDSRLVGCCLTKSLAHFRLVSIVGEGQGIAVLQLRVCPKFGLGQKGFYTERAGIASSGGESLSVLEFPCDECRLIHHMVGCQQMTFVSVS